MSRRRWLIAAVLATVAACGGGSAQSPSPPASAPLASASGGRATPDPSNSPPGAMPTELILGQTFGLFYDPRLEQVVLVNGAIEGGPDRPTELWRWSGSAWELLDAAGPPARSFAAHRTRSGARGRGRARWRGRGRRSLRRDARVGRPGLVGDHGHGARSTRRRRPRLRSGVAPDGAVRRRDRSCAASGHVGVGRCRPGNGSPRPVRARASSA